MSTTKPKRNDPCYCGSGKKYKHCHMHEDRQKEEEEKAQRVEQAVKPAAPSIPPVLAGVNTPPDLVQEPEEIDPEIERFNRLYENFSAAQYAEKITILRSAIEERSLDSELAFEFFNDLYTLMIEQDDRAEFANLATLLQTHQPEIYAQENQWFWSWEVTNALVLQDDAALQRAADQLIEHGGQDLDQFYPVFNCLLYHDRRQILLNAMGKHKPQIVAGKYFSGVEDEVNQKLADLVVLNYLETQPQNDLLAEDNVERLCSDLAAYTVDLLREDLATFIAWAGGLTKGQWSLNDFQITAAAKRQHRFKNQEDQKRKVEPALVHLRDLSNEFLHYARSAENVPLTKADLAREHLMTYIIKRQRGELTDQERTKKGHKKARAGIPNLLLPDHSTLDRYLTHFYGFLANGTYEGAALFELIPTWVRFLQTKGLVSTEEGHQALKSLQELSQSMVQLMERYNSDPALAANMQGWRANAGF